MNGVDGWMVGWVGGWVRGWVGRLGWWVDGYGKSKVLGGIPLPD
jgi:hypothetical protein